MKNILLIPLFLLTIHTFGNTSDSTKAYTAGKLILSAGYGLPSIDKSIYGNNIYLGFDMSFAKTGSGPFHFRVEYSLTDKFGIGISINYESYSGILSGINSEIYNGTITYQSIDKNTATAFSGLLRFNYHFATTKKLDPYFAIGAGFRSDNNNFTSNNPSHTFADYTNYVQNDPAPIPSVGLEAVAGLRYYISNNFGIYSEMGIAKSIIQFGISYKF